MDQFITLRIRKDSHGPVFTPAQMEQWTLEHFQGCDYGAVDIVQFTHAVVLGDELYGPYASFEEAEAAAVRIATEEFEAGRTDDVDCARIARLQ